MTNRKLAFIVKDQTPIVLAPEATVEEACRAMWSRGVGSVLVTDANRQLVGIFTGRDAVKAFAKGGAGADTRLSDVMTTRPVTIEPTKRAIDALRMMAEGGFRHLPVVDNGFIWGIVSRGDFKGAEIDRLDTEQHLWESIR